MTTPVIKAPIFFLGDPGNVRPFTNDQCNLPCAWVRLKKSNCLRRECQASILARPACAYGSLSVRLEFGIHSFAHKADRERVLLDKSAFFPMLPFLILDPDGFIACVLHAIPSSQAEGCHANCAQYMSLYCSRRWKLIYQLCGNHAVPIKVQSFTCRNAGRWSVGHDGCQGGESIEVTMTFAPESAPAHRPDSPSGTADPCGAHSRYSSRNAGSGRPVRAAGRRSCRHTDCPVAWRRSGSV